MTLDTDGSGARNYGGTGTVTLTGDADGEPLHYIDAGSGELDTVTRRAIDAPGFGHLALEAFEPTKEPRITLRQRAIGYSAMLDTSSFHALLTPISTN